MPIRHKKERQGQRQLWVLLMDEILHDFSYTNNPFQTLNLNIDLLAMLGRGVCANDRNSASPTCACNIEIRGARGAPLLTYHTCHVGSHAGFCPSTVVWSLQLGSDTLEVGL